MLQNLRIHRPVIKHWGQLVGVIHVCKSAKRLFIIWWHNQKTCRITYNIWSYTKVVSGILIPGLGIKKLISNLVQRNFIQGFYNVLRSYDFLFEAVRHCVKILYKDAIFTNRTDSHATGWSKASWSENETVRTSSSLKYWNHVGMHSGWEAAKKSQKHQHWHSTSQCSAHKPDIGTNLTKHNSDKNGYRSKGSRCQMILHMLIN